VAGLTDTRYGAALLGGTAVACGDKTIRLWEPRADAPGQPGARTTSLWKGLNAKVLALAFHPAREGVLAFGTEEGRVGVCDVTSQLQAAHSTRHAAPVMALSWRTMPGGAPAHLCSLAADGVLWEWRTELALSAGHRNAAEAASTGEATALTLAAELGGAPAVEDAAGGAPGHITDAAWAPDGIWLAVGRERGALEVWRASAADAGEWACTARLWGHAKGVTRVRWHPKAEPGGGRRLLSAAADGTLCAFVVASDGTASALVTVQAHRRCVQDAAWSPHAEALAATASVDGTARVWDLGAAAQHAAEQSAAQLPLAVLRGHDGRVLAVCWSAARADTLFTGSEDQTVRAWRWQDARHLPRPAVQQEAAAEEAPPDAASSAASDAAAAAAADATADAGSTAAPSAAPESGAASAAPQPSRRRRQAGAKSLMPAPALDGSAQGQQALRDACVSLVRGCARATGVPG
jgi:gem associated protein 5